MLKLSSLTKNICLGLVVSAGVGYGLSSEWQDFTRYTTLAAIVYGSVYYFINNKKLTDKRVAELQDLLEKKKTDERVEILENMLQESDNVIGEQEEVIKGYEMLLDDASVRFPCNCGKNVFDGIFKPNENYIVNCEACDNKYRVSLKLETALLTEPIEDLNIDKLIRENINDNI
jgi:hypothetical protein